MHLSETGRKIFMSYAVERRHEEQSELIIEQNEDTHVFLMMDGFANVTAHASDGKTVIYDQVGPGDLVGVLAAIDGLPRSASVLTRGPCRTASMSGVKFCVLLREEPRFAQEIQLLLVAKIRQLSVRVFEFSTQLVRERLVRELLRQMDPTTQSDGPQRINPAPTHFELAARISTHREAVSREISRLARLGIIAREGRSLVVQSRAALIGELECPIDCFTSD